MALHESPLTPAVLARRHKDQIKAYVKRQAEKENPRPKPTVVLKPHDAVEIRLEGQMYPCQVVDIDRITGLFTVAFSFGPKTPVQVEGIPRKTLRKISTPQWMDDSKRLKHQDPGAIDRVTSLATKLAKWSSMPEGEKAAVRHGAAAAKDAAMGSHKAAVSQPQVATRKIKAQVARTKALNEKAAAANAAKVQRDNEVAERAKAFAKKRAERLRAGKASQADARARMLAAHKAGQASNKAEAPSEAAPEEA